MASTLTADHIVAIYPADNSVTKEQAEVYLPYFIEACREHGITDKNRVAGFLGQLGEESGEFVYFEELWGPTDAQASYEGRVDLGNTEPGDGYYFRGSGPIQITGRDNTTRVCHALGLPVDPDLLRQPKDGFRAAAYFWTNMGNDCYDTSNNGATNLNRFADAGDQDAMTYGVNGGWTHKENRDWYYNKAMEVLPDDLDLSGGEATVTEPAIERSESMADQITLGYDQEGWAYDTASGLYVKSTPNLDHNTNKDGWLWAKVGTAETAADTVQIVADTVQIAADTVVETAAETEQAAASTWSWPEAWDDPIPDSPWYVERCPTRYTWPGNRDDVDAWACWLVNNYDVTVNTYLHHPEDVWINKGISREYDSFDVWGPGGRGDPIGYELGQEIFWRLRNDPNPPNIEWIIWQGWMYGAWNNWEGEHFSDDTSDADMGHFRHIHVTYEPAP